MVLTSIIDAGEDVIIPNSLGIRTTPSYVTFLSENKICVGELAKLFPSNKKNIIYYTKRLLGKNINDMKKVFNQLLLMFQPNQ